MTQKQTIQLSNLEMIPNMIVTEHYGIVSGSSVKARHIFLDMLAGIKHMLGGEINTYTALVKEARQQALDEMISTATALNQNINAILNIRYEACNITSGAAEIYVYGTAVRVE